MLKRKIGDEVKINPHNNVMGVIIDNKEITTDSYYNKDFDYKVKLNQSCEFGAGDNSDWQFFNDDELDFLEKNYDMSIICQY
jgi:hypothetical protein